MTLHCQNVAIWLGLLVAVASGEGLAAGPASTERLAESAITHAPTIEAWWTDTPPVLDGHADDACWRDAPTVTTFTLLGTNTPARHPVQARVCYDAEKLYVFMRAEGPPFTSEELITSRRKTFQNWGEELLGYDQVGFLLEQPINPHVDCFYFAVNAVGRRSDNRSEKNAAYGKDTFHVLETRTVRGTNGWTAEMSVPFHELTSWYANMSGTPTVGSVWNILFFRENGRFDEHVTCPPAQENYRGRRELGRIAFRGRRAGPQLPSITMKVPESGDAFAEIKADTDEPLHCDYVQTKKDRLVEKGRKTFRGTLRLPWIMKRDVDYWRRYQMRVVVRQGGERVYMGDCNLNIVAANNDDKLFRKAIDINLKRLEGVPGDRAGRLRDGFANLRTRLDDLKARVDACERVGDDDWNTHGSAIKKMRKEELDSHPENRYLPYVLHALHTVRQALARAGDALTLLDAAEPVTALAARVSAMGAEHDALTGRAETCPNELAAITNLMAEASDLAREQEALDFDIWRAGLARERPGAPFAVFPLRAYDKAFRKKRIVPPLLDRIELAAAGNESESFQVCLVPLSGAGEGVTIRLSPLAGEEGVARTEIPASALSWRIVDYVHMLGAEENHDPLFHEDPSSSFARKWYPDPLYPGEPFTLPVDETKTIWVDVHCPSNTPPGAYTGSVSVAAGGTEVSIPIRFKVYDFSLPAKPSLRINHWFAPVYGQDLFGPDASATYTPEMFEQDCAFLARYRIPHFLDHRDAVMPQIPLYYEGDGRITADFSNLATFYDIAEKYGANWVSASFGCNNGAFWGWNNGWHKIIDRRTGEKKPLLEVFPDFYAEIKEARLDNFDNPAWQQFVNQFADFLDERGLLENNTYYEIRDEADVDEVIKAHKRLREVCPKMPLGNYGPHPLQVNRWGETSAAYTDIWGPLLNLLDDPELEAAVRDRGENHGERCMPYLCSSNDNVPHLCFHRSYLGPRLAHWQAWRLKADAFLMFRLNAPPLKYRRDKALLARPLETRFKGPREVARGMEPWMTDPLYMGPNRALVPSMRLSAIRDGMEDYEYFHLLKTRADAFQPESDEDRALLQKARAALDIPRDICGRVNEWTTDQERVEAHREKLAEWIVMLGRGPE